MDPRSVDFRLLECLQTLIAERHVTKAAERLGMSQPKLSSVLARLRQLTGDPLLVRTSEGMVPTDMARQLAASTEQFLSSWKGLVGGDQSFNPETADHTFRIQVTDFILKDLIVSLVSELRSIAPNVAISVYPPSAGLREKLETGEIDLVIGYVPGAPQDLYITQLYSYQSCCVVARNHPRIGNELTFEQYVAEGHVILTFGRTHQPFVTEQYVDGLLAERNVHRRAAAFVPSALVVPDIVARTDLVALIPRPLAEGVADQLALKLLEPPFPLPLQGIAMVWHARTNNDLGSRWLRGVVRRLVQDR
jgi:DNA-binding transcriptional LysR family regulator